MRTTTKSTVTLALLFLMLGFAGRANALAQAAGQIEAIKRHYQKTNDEIARSEQEPDASTTFLTELAVNKNLSPYPAVGIYKTVARFYYTFGDREQEPYPNRLLKVVISTDRSDRKEYSEFLFDEAQQLVFYFEKKDEIERRIYFNLEKPIRFQQGERPLSLRNKSQTAFVTNVLTEKASLVDVFRRSLRF